MERPTPEQIEYQIEHYEETYAPEVHISMSICLGLATVAVILRVIARRMSKASIRQDDHMIFFALFFAAAYVTCNFVSIHFGGMKHVIAIEHPVEVAKLIMAIEVLYQPSITCVKLSCLLLLHRIFPNRRLHVILWCVGIVVMIYSTIGVFTTIFACRPIRAAWDPSVKHPKCLDLNMEFVIQAVFNVITDFIILILPMPLLWKLHLPRNRKLELMGIFLTGSFVCAVSIWRVPHMKLANQDASYVDAPAAIWSGVEICVGIVGACLPTLRPIVAGLSKAVVDTVTRKTVTSSNRSTSTTRECSKSLEDIIGLQTIRKPSSTYVPPNRGMGTVTRAEAAPLEQARRNRSSDHYWKLDADDNNV